MNDKLVQLANIENLTQLWQQMGATPCVLNNMKMFQISLSWPNRCWYDAQLPDNKITAFSHSINQVSEKFIIPVWMLADTPTKQLKNLLLKNGFEMLFQQTAMHLDLESHSTNEQSDFKLITINLARNVQTWTNVAARSFAYKIDQSVIQKIENNPDIELLTAYCAHHPAATALLYTTGNVTGVHQMGVLPEYRGQGIARKLMQHIINLAHKKTTRHITLQASAVAEPLYKSLGFKPQFKIDNFRSAK